MPLPLLRLYAEGGMPIAGAEMGSGLDIAHLRQWIGSTETRVERLAAFPANALAATLDRDDAEYHDGDALPPLWHWLHFLSATPLAGVGPDGHAARGGFLPPVPLPRRMWAGSRFRFDEALRIGAVLRKVSTVTRVEHKEGRTGDLVFVTVRHEIGPAGAVHVEEEHDIVYRAAATPGAPAPTPARAPEDSAFSRVIRPDPVLLFRYSALTFNGHRIHYDQPYATGVEGYPGLVVHGPLIATLLLDLLRRKRPETQVTGFRVRNLATLYATEAFSVHGAPGAGGVRLWARRGDGAMAMEATAELASSGRG